MILRAGQEVLGTSKGRIPPGDKETWWWNDEVKDAIRANKEAKEKWETPGRQEERERETSIDKQTRRQRKK